jgi:hypothetical protein
MALIKENMPTMDGQTMNSSSIGQRLRLFLTTNRIAVSKFADACEIPARSMHNYLSGKTNPGAEHLARMGDHGVDLNWLLTGKMPQLLTLSLGHVEGMKPVSGIVAADRELATLLMKEAVDVVDAQIRGNPELVAKLGAYGVVLSIWSAFSCYATTFNGLEGRLERARREGWKVADLVPMIASQIRERVEASLSDASKAIVSGKWADHACA